MPQGKPVAVAGQEGSRAGSSPNPGSPLNGESPHPSRVRLRDLQIAGELRLDLDAVLGYTRVLVPLIDPNAHSGGTVPTISRTRGSAEQRP